jgi:hypothetical protein
MTGLAFEQLSRLLLVGLASLLCVPAAQARNTMLLLPIDVVLRQSATRQLIGADMALRFGGATPDGAELLLQVDGHGVVRPHAGYNGNKEIRKTDEQACQEAFRTALADMVSMVRRGGGTALVGIVSNYRGVVMSSTAQFECHAGETKALVDLKGTAARWSAAAAAKPIQASVAKVAARSGGEEGGGEPHRRRVPAASGFSGITDADAVPISDEGKARYRHFLTLQSPKAFVVYQNGGWRFFWNDPEAMTKALDRCERDGRVCWLYAVDDRVVWSADVAKRIGKSSQLVDK